MKGIKNLRVAVAALCLGTTLLTGCNNNGTEIVLDNGTIEYNYDDNEITGDITFEDLNKYGKIVTIEDNGEQFTRLLIKEEGYYSGVRTNISDHDYIKYIDLETGATLMYYKYYTSKEEEVWEAGKDLTIVSETGIISYLINNDFVKTDYTVEEIVTFVNDTVIPSIDLSEKELVK